MTGSFLKRSIITKLTLATGAFGAQLGNTVVLSGLRVTCDIDKSGQPSKNTAKLKIYGMSVESMKQLTTMGQFTPRTVRRNRIGVLAGEVNRESLVFSGDIVSAWSVYQSAPDVFFQIEAITGYYDAIAPATPKSYRGGASVAGIMSGIAEQMGLAFQNNGVTARLNNPYFAGSLHEQADRAAHAANIEFGIDDGTMFIAPRGRERQGRAVRIAPETGLKGYPVFNKEGIMLECLFNPSLLLGGLISVSTSVPNASGIWRVHKLTHRIASEDPGGPWFSAISAAPVPGASPVGF